jgi:hypothetical protein
VLVCIAHDPGARLRDIAATLGVTERRAHGIVTGLAGAGYVVTRKDGRRNGYQVQARLPLAERLTRNPPSARSSPSCWETRTALPARQAARMSSSSGLAGRRPGG